MLVSHEHGTCRSTIERETAVVQSLVNVTDALADSITESDDLVERRPIRFVNGYLGVILCQISGAQTAGGGQWTYMDLGGIIDIRIDTALEDVLEECRVSGFAISQSGEVDIEECRTTKSADRLRLSRYEA